MTQAVTITAVLPNVAATLQTYALIKVYRSLQGAGGPYAEVTSASTRIPIVAGQSGYEFTDPASSATAFYAVSYFNPTTGAESSLSDPMQGDSDPALGIVSVDDLKTNYLVGLDLTTPQGVAFPTSLYEFYIKAAVSSLERKLDIPLRPLAITGEKHPYYPEDFRQWGYIQLDQSPCISISALRMQLPGGAAPISFPLDSLMLDQFTGVLQIVPGQTGTLPFAYGGFNLLSRQWAHARMIPNAFQVDYSAGFPPGQVPMELVELVAKMASFGPLNIAGDLLGGAGIASQSIGIDGLSQSVNTTSSPMFAGYGARLNNYTKEIDAQIPELRRYYKGMGLAVI